MGLLRKLFCKKEPQPAPAPEPTPEGLPAYVPRSPADHTQELTCVWCGKVELVQVYNRPREGWKSFHGYGLPHDGVESCPSCREAVEAWKRQAEEHNLRREALQRKNRSTAYEARKRWDAAHPAVMQTVPASTFVFIRRTTCGSCGMHTDIEGKQHQLPSWPSGWKRVCLDRGPMVCPDCYEKHEPLRETHKKWATDRDQWVGSFFRAADEGLPPIMKLKAPSRWKPW